jgi:hypothetical protein
MKAGDFVKQLESATPNIVDLKRGGLSDAEAHEFKKSFTCAVRAASADSDGDVDELVQLLNHWDCGKVQIGMVQFLDRPVRTVCGMRVGLVEADPLLLRSSDGAAIVVESGSETHVLWFAAKNGEKFLDAIIRAAQFLGKRATGEIDFDDIASAKSAADQCASIAGGEKYVGFFGMLLGADS